MKDGKERNFDLNKELVWKIKKKCILAYKHYTENNLKQRPEENKLKSGICNINHYFRNE